MQSVGFCIWLWLGTPTGVFRLLGHAERGPAETSDLIIITIHVKRR